MYANSLASMIEEKQENVATDHTIEIHSFDLLSSNCYLLVLNGNIVDG